MQSSAFTRLSLDPESSLMLRRFAIALTAMVVWAVAINPQYPLRTLLLMTSVAAAVHAFIAMLRRDPFNAAALNYWDSTCGFFAINCLMRGLT